MDLKLTLKKQWFDMILSGEKLEEYRVVKPFWESRLNKIMDGSVEIENVHFFNGAYFSENLPNFKIEFKGIERCVGKDGWGAVGDTEYFVIKLGKVIKT